MSRGLPSATAQVLAITAGVAALASAGWMLQRHTITHALREALAATATPWTLPNVRTTWMSVATARGAGVAVPLSNCDLVAELETPNGARSAFLGVDLFALLILPGAIGVGASLGTPVAFGRRLKITALTTALLGAVLLMRIELVLVETALAGEAPLAGAAPVFKAAVSALASSLVHPPATQFIIPLVVWLLLAWPALRRLGAAGAPAVVESTAPRSMP